MPSSRKQWRSVPRIGSPRRQWLLSSLRRASSRPPHPPRRFRLEPGYRSYQLANQVHSDLCPFRLRVVPARFPQPAHCLRAVRSQLGLSHSPLPALPQSRWPRLLAPSAVLPFHRWHSSIRRSLRFPSPRNRSHRWSRPIWVAPTAQECRRPNVLPQSVHPPASLSPSLPFMFRPPLLVTLPYSQRCMFLLRCCRMFHSSRRCAYPLPASSLPASPQS